MAAIATIITPPSSSRYSAPPCPFKSFKKIFSLPANNIN